MSDRRFRVDPRTAPPADPWGTDEPTLVDLPQSAPAGRGKVFGRVYELITGDPRDGEHPYGGQTTKTIHQRVHGPGGHTSPESVRKDPWKARILPGRAGYRLLETVYTTGDERADERMLDRAEAFWIDRLRPTYNTVRPVRPPLHERQPVRPARVVKPKPRRSRTQSAARRRLLTFVVLTLMATVAWAVRLGSMAWDNATTPWIASPGLGVLTAWALYFGFRRVIRNIKRRW